MEGCYVGTDIGEGGYWLGGAASHHHVEANTHTCSELVGYWREQMGEQTGDVCLQSEARREGSATTSC